MRRSDVAWILAAPFLWAIWFVVAYSLHGLGCSLWPGRSWGALDANHLLQWIAWAMALMLHVAILFKVRQRIAMQPELGMRSRKLLAWSAWLGAASTLFTGLPIVFIAPC